MTKRKPRDQWGAVGRPTKYKPEFCQKMIDFFDREYALNDVKIAQNEKCGSSEKGGYSEVQTNLKRVGNTLPTFERFAFEVGVCYDSLVEWSHVHPDFSVAYKACKRIQRDMLIQNSLDGLYNTTFAIFLAKNITDLRNEPEDRGGNKSSINIDIQDENL